MDNIIQNIPIEDIIPIQIPNENDISSQMNELKESIKKYGIVEPLLVRKKDNKYEIIAGRKRYIVAKKLGIKEVPVLIRNIEMNFYSEQKKEKIEKKNKFINPTSIKNTFLPKNIEKKNSNIPTIENSTNDNNNFSNIIRNNNTNNSDIINLSELNKKENERDEFKMNNQTMNNQGVQTQNIGTPQGQAPTFGGRFFPSLEDEPTNMNMDGMNIIGTAMQNSTPVQNNQMPNNELIDLTDENNEQVQQPNYNIEQPTMVNPLEESMPNMQVNQQDIMNKEYIQQPVQQEYQTPEEIKNPQPAVENKEALENQKETTFEQPINQPINNEYPNIQPQQDSIQSQMTLNQPVEMPQFDMSQSMMTPNNMEATVNYNTQPTEQTQVNMPNYNIDPEMQQPTAPIPSYDNQTELNNQMPTNNEYQMPMQQENFTQPQNYNQPLNQELPQQETNEIAQFPQKEVEPVINAIRSLSNNLTAFGYNINISEEDLGRSVKITIEIQK